MLKSFEISIPKTHVAIVDYSGKPSVKIDFTKGQEPTKLKERIKKVPRGTGGRLEDGIKFAADGLFSPKYGSRLTARKTLVIMLDKKDLPDVEKPKKKLKKKGVKVVVLALGEDVDRKKARKLPTTPDLLEMAESLVKKPKVPDDLVEKVTQGTVVFGGFFT